MRSSLLLFVLAVVGLTLAMLFARRAERADSERKGERAIEAEERTPLGSASESHEAFEARAERAFVAAPVVAPKAGLELRVVDAVSLDTIPSAEVFVHKLDGTALHQAEHAPGHFTLTSLKARDVLVVRADGFVTRVLERAEVGGEGGRMVVALEPHGVLALKLVDSSGIPIAHSDLDLHAVVGGEPVPSPAGWPSLRARWEHEMIPSELRAGADWQPRFTDPDGLLVVHHLPLGGVVGVRLEGVRLRRGDQDVWESEVRLVVGAREPNPTPVLLVAEAIEPITGRVVDEAGNGLTGLRVDLVTVERPQRRTAWTGVDGRYAFDLEDTGPVLLAAADEVERGVEFAATFAQREAPDIVLAGAPNLAGRVDCQVHGIGSGACAAGEARVRSPHGDEHAVTFAKDGSFARRVPEGELQLSLRNAHGIGGHDLAFELVAPDTSVLLPVGLPDARIELASVEGAPHSLAAELFERVVCGADPFDLVRGDHHAPTWAGKLDAVEGGSWGAVVPVGCFGMRVVGYARDGAPTGIAWVDHVCTRELRRVELDAVALGEALFGFEVTPTGASGDGVVDLALRGLTPHFTEDRARALEWHALSRAGDTLELRVAPGPYAWREPVSGTWTRVTLEVGEAERVAVEGGRGVEAALLQVVDESGAPWAGIACRSMAKASSLPPSMLAGTTDALGRVELARPPRSAEARLGPFGPHGFYAFVEVVAGPGVQRVVLPRVTSVLPEVRVPNGAASGGWTLAAGADGVRTFAWVRRTGHGVVLPGPPREVELRYPTVAARLDPEHHEPEVTIVRTE